MTLKDLCDVLHDLPVWVNTAGGCEYFKDGWAVPRTDNIVSYVTVDGAGVLTVEVDGDLWT